MGLRPLGPRRVRLIERVTGLPIARAVGDGGYVFGFTTPPAPGHPRHRHGWFDLYEHRRGKAAGVVWGFEDGPVQCWWSCRELYPEDEPTGR